MVMWYSPKPTILPKVIAVGMAADIALLSMNLYLNREEQNCMSASKSKSSTKQTPNSHSHEVCKRKKPYK